MKEELCIWCGCATGKAVVNEDSLYSDSLGIGPFCNECWEDLRKTFEEEIYEDWAPANC